MEKIKADKQKVNKAFDEVLRGKEISQLKVEFEDIKASIDVATKRLASSIEKRNELSRKIANYDTTIFDIYSKIQEVSRSSKVESVDIDIDKKIITAHTKPLRFTTRNGGLYQLGRFDITFSPSTKDIRFYGLDEQYSRRSYWSHDDPHPHVSGNSGEACLGNTNESIAYLCGEHEYQALFEILIAFLEQANIDDCAGKHAMNWDLIDSEGNVIREGYKDECYESFSYGDTPDGDSFGETRYCYHCEDCFDIDDLTYVDGEYVCDECLNDHYVRCQDCNEWVIDDEAYQTNDGYVCDSCSNSYSYCERCNYYVKDDEFDGDLHVCLDCRDIDYTYCDNCREYVSNDDYNNETDMCVECEKKIEADGEGDGTTFECEVCHNVFDKEGNDQYINEQHQICCENCIPF